jgi:hypothetical protein
LSTSFVAGGWIERSVAPVVGDEPVDGVDPVGSVGSDEAAGELEGGAALFPTPESKSSRVQPVMPIAVRSRADVIAATARFLNRPVLAESRVRPCRIPRQPTTRLLQANGRLEIPFGRFG